jgi:hypothetical protein
VKTVLVRYRVRAEMAAVNESLIRGVFDQLRAVAPAGLSYQAYKLGDGCSFVHWAHIDTSDGSNPLLALDAFQRFQHALRDRCSELPVATDLFPVDSYAADSA